MSVAPDPVAVANRTHSEFLATMSHELRTPLNAIIGLSESLLEINPESDPARTRRYLELIHAAGRQLYGEINDVLDLARLEAGRLRVNPASMDVGSVCAGVADSVRGDAALKQLQVEVSRPADALVIEADERLVTQAVYKIVRNAVKFTPAGGRVTIVADAASAGGACISIADTGVGIPAEKLHLLFKPFSQVDSSLGRRYGGAGLGLVLADRFVRLHGGTIAVASEPVQGSTFTITLPAHPKIEVGPGTDDYDQAKKP